MTADLVERVLPLVIESLSLALSPGQEPEALLTSARGWLMNLLVFVAAAENGQLPATTAAQGLRLLAGVCGRQRRPARQQPLVLRLGSFLQRVGARAWGRFAPQLVALPACEVDRGASWLRTPDARSSDAVLTAALQPLFADSSAAILGFTPRLLGALHEALLGRTIQIAGTKATWIMDRQRRRQSGSYYTPEPLITMLVEQSLGPVLKRHLRSTAASPRARGGRTPPARAASFRLIDPAMGAGYFLAAALEYLADQLGAGNPGSQRSRLLERLLAESIYGIDADPESVELARVSLWLASGLPARQVACLTDNLVAGDALLDKHLAAGDFDAVIGNPPYGTPDREYRARLKRALPATRRNADLAAGFVFRAAELVAPHGRVGFVLPKPLTYSYAWRQVRADLHGRVRWLCNVGRGWDNVLLEQVLMVFDTQPQPSAGYRVAALAGEQVQRLPRVPSALTDRFDVLLASLTPRDRLRLDAMRFADESVGDRFRTFRGLPWQRSLSAAGDCAVYGGRDLTRWALRNPSGFVSHRRRNDLPPTSRSPKLLFQNIVAHIERPEPHIRLIGTLDESGSLALDTVNQLV
ncbi:MAG: N-6 DNA methylase, partial [Planctomycetaceae bacterium]|nr:N-6 DNA methylase [Planctomycetaceae bacterium]